MLTSDIIIDNSIMRTVLTCSTAAVLRYGLDLAPLTEGVAMLQGQAGHTAMAVWLETSGDIVQAMGAYKKAYQRVVQAAWEQLPGEDKDRARLAYPRTAQILQDWLEINSQWMLTVRPGQQETEQVVQAPLMVLKDGRQVTFVAVLDALARRRTGGYWSVDHKFRKGVTDWWKATQEDAAQFTGQAWLSREKGLKLAGTYVNAIELPQAKTAKKKCPTHGVAYTECDTKHVNHLLFPVTRSVNEIAAWHRTITGKVPKWVALKDRVRDLGDIHTVPMEGRFNGGCTFCSFRQWCRVDRPTGGRGDWFREFHWDPTAGREE